MIFVLIVVFTQFLEKGIYYQASTMRNKESNKITTRVDGNIQIISGNDYCTFKRKNKTFKSIVEYNYNGILFNGSKDAEESIREIYGDGWKVYDPDYDDRYGPDYNLPECINNAKSILFLKPIKEYPKIEIIK